MPQCPGDAVVHSTIFCNQEPKVRERIHLLQLLILNEYAARYSVARHYRGLVDVVVPSATMRVHTMQAAKSNVTVAEPESAPQADTRSVCVIRTTVGQYFN